MRILVTGGAGFIGSHIVDALLAGGHAVAVLDNLSTGRPENVPAGVALYQDDIRSAACGAILAREKPECIIHQAAQVSVAKSLADPAGDAAINIAGTINLLEHARRAGVRKIVYASSAAVYGNPAELPLTETAACRPLSPYGASKLAGEYYLAVYAANYGLSYTALRYANVYGPRQVRDGEGGVVTIFTGELLAGRKLTVHGDGEQTRDFVYVEDVAAANVLALTRGDNAVYNIGTGSSISLNRLAAELGEAAGQTAKIAFSAPQPGDIRHSRLAAARAAADLGWQPRVSLAAGLRRTVRSFRED
ncbi:MAG: NAD-dependent epimerase/dehydratase family protein [bacterium]|jgi:UDP-glucose 4-epimerase